MRTKSSQAFELAKKVLVGGVNSPVRSFKSVGGDPVFFERGEGSKLYDIDGNAYIDYIGSWGPQLLGHQNREIIDSVIDVLNSGTGFGAPHQLETKLAERVVAMVPSIEKVRMVNSGTEATMSAIRLARGVTGRSKIVKFSGCYHGHSDSFLIKAGSGALTIGEPDSPGVVTGTAENTLIAEFNNLESVAKLFSEHVGDIAAIIVEPYAGNMGFVQGSHEFLSGLQNLTSENKSLLIFDEVMTGFRLAKGGVQELTGIIPDLTCLGKIIGGGLPVGAFGGRSELMDQLAPLGSVYQAGTMSGNPVSMIAGYTLLNRLEEEPGIYEELDQKGQMIEVGVKKIIEKAKIPLQFARVGSMFTLFFNDRPVQNFEDALKSDTQNFARYFEAMLASGISLPPSQFELCFISHAHSESDLQSTLDAMEESLLKL